MGVSSRLSAVAAFFASILFAASLAAGCGTDEGDGAGPGAGGEPIGSECRQAAECQAPLAHCKNGRCVACLSDEDCDTGHCDGQNRCVACLEDEHCEDGVCSPLGHCVECVDGEDCPSGHCLQGECLPEGMCTAAIRCEEGFHCVAHAPGATRGICEAACDVLDPVCEDGLLCALRGFDDDNQPYGSCTEPTGGAQEGDSCLHDRSSCEEDLICVSRTSIDVRCSSFCDPEAEEPTCPAGSSCEEIEFTTGNTIGACIADDVPCQSNDDCPEDERCSITGSGGMICIKAVGPGKGGDACTSGLQCDAGICLNNSYCMGACADPSNCSEGNACLYRFLASEDEFFYIPICVATCDSDEDCAANQRCDYETSRRPDGFVRTCMTRFGEGSGGADCSTGSECKSGICDARPNGYCRGSCETEDDCGPRTTCVDRPTRVSSGPDGTFDTEDDPVGIQRVCLPHECQTDAECDGDWICRPEIWLGWSSQASLQLRCNAPAGELPAGAACESDRDCASNTCLEHPDGDPERVCFSPCVAVDAECADGLRCVQEAARLPYGLGEEAIFASCIP